MAVRIHRYEVGHFTYGERMSPNSVPDARIICYREDGRLCARIDFLDEGAVPRALFTSSNDDGAIHLRMDLNRYAAVLDLLRNEGPIWIWCAPPVAGIYTGRERVGEEEASFFNRDITELFEPGVLQRRTPP